MTPASRPPRVVDEQAALEIACRIGERIADPATVGECYAQHPIRDLDGEPVAWTAAGLAAGTAGTALLHAALGFATGDGIWRRRAHAHLEAAAAVRPQGMGLYDGWAGLLASARYAAGGGSAYSRLVESLRRVLEPWAVGHADPGFAAVETTGDYDLISGAAGVLMALRELGPSEACDALIGYVDRLVSDPGGLRWRAPFPIFGRGEKPVEVQANNLGLAHGLPGMLAATALCDGSTIARDAAARMTAWLVRHATTASHGAAHWPSAIELGDGTVHHGPVAWCYGTPGVCAALSLAATALGDGDLMRRTAASLVEAAGSGGGRLADDGICHGRSGVALVAASVGRCAGDQRLLDVSGALFSEVIAAFDARAPLGYRMIDAVGQRFDNPGLLDGAAGVGLALLTASGVARDGWLRCFAIPANLFRSTATGRPEST